MQQTLLAPILLFLCVQARARSRRLWRKAECVASLAHGDGSERTAIKWRVCEASNLWCSWPLTVFPSFFIVEKLEYRHKPRCFPFNFSIFIWNNKLSIWTFSVMWSSAPCWDWVVKSRICRPTAKWMCYKMMSQEVELKVCFDLTSVQVMWLECTPLSVTVYYCVKGLFLTSGSRLA